MTPLQIEALEAARHELVTLNGLLAADGMSPGETFSIDTTATIAILDAAFTELFGCDSRPA